MADQGIKAGDAFIEVTLRMAPDAWKRLTTDNRGQAGKAGDDLGDRIGKAIAKRIAAGVRDGLATGTAGVGAQGAKAGGDYGDKFATVVKTRIEAALRSLPKPNVDLGTTAAEEKLRELRAQLQDLSGKRIGVDVTAEEALNQVRRIKAELDDLGARSPDIRVKTDTAAASAKLAAIEAELDRINGKTADAKVKTNADDEKQKVFTLANALAILGPAAVPSAAAAAAAILGIGSAATSVFAAIGVGKLAFSGIGDALKAMDTAQQNAAKSGATLSQQQNQLASGADQVKSAEAALANTRASAAESVRRANEQIGVSEQTLADAQRADLQATKDLTTAREDARRSIEDLNLQVADGAIAQRQAALDVQKAKEELDAVNAAGSTATVEQRQQAQITYDQAVQQVTDLAVRQQRAVQDRDAANKAGIEGSKQVTQAQQALLQANQKVADAERGVADARAAAADASRQAAYSVAQAQQQVINAQRSLGQAVVSTSASGATAVDALQAALSKLSPEGQKFATFLYGLKPQLDQLKESAQNGLLPGAQAGITTLLPYFSQLDHFVASVANELGSLERQAAQTFTNPFWRGFFEFVASQAVPNLDKLYHSTIDVAEGGARIIAGFAPVETQVGTIITGLTTRFAAFSQNIGNDTSFQRLVGYVEVETPHVIALLGDLTTTASHLVAGFAPVGGSVVGELRVLSTVLNALPVSVVQALATAFTTYKTAALLSTGAQLLVNSGLVTGALKMVGYAGATNLAAASTAVFQRNQAALTAFIGGPLLIGLTIAAGAILYFYQRAQQGQQQMAALSNTLGQLGTEYASTGHISKDTFQTMAAGNTAVVTLTQALQRQGYTLDDLGRSYQGNVELQDRLRKAAEASAAAAKKARDDYLAALNSGKIPKNNDGVFGYFEGLGDQQSAKLKELTQRADDLKQAADALGESYRKAATQAGIYAQATNSAAEASQRTNEALATVATTLTNVNASADGYRAAIAGVGSVSADAGGKAAAYAAIAAQVGSSQATAAEKATLFGQVLDGIGQAATTSGPVFDGLDRAFSSIARASLDAHDKVNLLNQALKAMYQPSIDAVEAQENLVRTQSDLKVQLGQSSAGFDLNSAKATGNATAILQNRDALEAALQAARDKYVQDLAAGVAEDTARATHDKAIASILAGIPVRQRDSAAVQELVRDYGQIPPKVITDVSTPGLDQAISQLIEAHAVQFGLAQTPPWTKDQIANEVSYLQTKISGAPSQALFHAAGGAIFGPGTGTSDSVPAWLSTGEHVWTAAEVQAAGGHGNVEALRQAALERQLPGFAAGGAVWPITIPSNPQPPVPLAQLWRQWNALQQAAATAPGTVSGDLGVGRTIFEVAQQLHASRKVLLSAIETVLVESGMTDPKVPTDRDSLGPFQQRPSQGWGTPAQVTDVAYAAHAYLVRAIANEARYATAGQLAQSVQRSAFPDRYDKRQADAEAVIAAITGGSVGSAVAGVVNNLIWNGDTSGLPQGRIDQIKAFIQSTDPLPYVFGAAGTNGYDCSVLAGAVFGLITGRGGGHGQRYFTTASFGGGTPPAGFKPGVGGVLTVGVNPARHMDGVFAGVPFEAKSTAKGIVVGPGTTPVTAFPKQFHLAQGGPVDPGLLNNLGVDIGGDPSGMTINGRKVPYKLFDSGGWLMPGLTLADNRTGRPEVVPSPRQPIAQPTNFNVIVAARDGAMRDLLSMVDVRVEAAHSREAALVGSGVRDY